MMTRSLEDEYLEWLSGQIKNTHRQKRDKTYWELIEILFGKEFVWLIPNDDNRVADGLDLRTEFQAQVMHTNTWIELWDHGCSVLETLIGLSRRVAFATDGEPDLWAWVLIENLGLGRMHDPLSKAKRNQIDEILENLIWRTYGADGTGGFFPLAFPEANQTEVEIWYQMNAYVEEMPPH